MELIRAFQNPVGQGKAEYHLQVRFQPEEAKKIMAQKDLFAGEGIPLDPSVQIAGVSVFIDTPLQIGGLMIADEDTAARFVCTAELYPLVARGLDEYLRSRLACIWAELG